MPTGYPASLDALTNVNDAIEAIQAALGVNPAATAGTVAARVAAAESSATALAARVATLEAHVARLKQPPAYETTTFTNTTRSDGTEVSIGSLVVPDPGYAYQLRMAAGVLVFINASNGVRGRLRLGSVTGTVVGGTVAEDAAGHSTTMGTSIVLPLRRSGTLTGATTVHVTLQRISGTGSWNATGADSWLTAMVVPWVA
jgi:hypothetical protein